MSYIIDGILYLVHGNDEVVESSIESLDTLCKNNATSRYSCRGRITSPSRKTPFQKDEEEKTNPLNHFDVHTYES